VSRAREEHRAGPGVWDAAIADVGNPEVPAAEKWGTGGSAAHQGMPFPDLAQVAFDKGYDLYAGVSRRSTRVSDATDISKRTRLVLAEDDLLLREGLAVLLSRP